MSRPRRIYLDNAATSWPKPEQVDTAVQRYQRECGAPAGRSAYAEAAEVERGIARTRVAVAQLLGVDNPARIVFAFNGTDALNMAIWGVVREGDHVVTTVVEHNSVLRPLRYLEENHQVRLTIVDCDQHGVVSPESVAAAMNDDTRLVVISHASNVTGAIQPVAEIGRVAHESGALLLVDAAQSLGHLRVDCVELNADLLAAPGHKGLLGPLGTGVLYVRPGLEDTVRPLRQGGTGTQSEDDHQPTTMPDRFESGNHNVPGLLGLGAGVEFLKQTGLEQLRQHEQQLTGRLMDGLKSLSGVTVHGPSEASARVGVVSISVDGYDPQEIAAMLDAGRRIQVRSGLHCAPLMHRALGTTDGGGTLRFSLGAFNTSDDVDEAIAAITELAAMPS